MQVCFDDFIHLLHSCDESVRGTKRLPLVQAVLGSIHPTDFEISREPDGTRRIHHAGICKVVVDATGWEETQAWNDLIEAEWNAERGINWSELEALLAGSLPMAFLRRILTCLKPQDFSVHHLPDGTWTIHHEGFCKYIFHAETWGMSPLLQSDRRQRDAG